jgi:hypothetical protein
MAEQKNSKARKQRAARDSSFALDPLCPNIPFIGQRRFSSAC